MFFRFIVSHRLTASVALSSELKVELLNSVTIM